MKETLDKVKQLIRKTGMLRDCRYVVAGVSGGADSVFLFYILKQMESVYGFHLHVVHVNHEIRGAEADGDEQFVRDLCAEHGVPLTVCRRNIPAYALRQKMTLEEAGRCARYEIFRAEARRLGGDDEVRIALAHHQNDAVETMLFQMARGCGLDGMAAIRPVRGNVIRPLLAVTKEEILTYLTVNGIAWREDSTNADNDAVRNRIRHDVIPYMVREVNAGTISHLAAEAADCAEAAEFIHGEAVRRASQYVSFGAARRTDCAPDFPESTAAITSPDTEKFVSIGAISAETVSSAFISDEILREPDIIRREIIRQVLCRLAGSLKDIARVHIGKLDGLLGHDTGAALDLPYGIVAEREQSCVHLRKRERRPDGISSADAREREEAREHAFSLVPGEKGRLGGYLFSAEVISRKGGAIPEKRYTKWFDYDTINTFSMTFRYREPGDFLTVNAEGGRKKLSDYFTDEKVPARMRDRIPVLADGKEIIWIVGMRIGYRFRVRPETTNVLVVTAEQESSD